MKIKRLVDLYRAYNSQTLSTDYSIVTDPNSKRGEKVPDCVVEFELETDMSSILGCPKERSLYQLSQQSKSIKDLRSKARNWWPGGFFVFPIGIVTNSQYDGFKTPCECLVCVPNMEPFKRLLKKITFYFDACKNNYATPEALEEAQTRILNILIEQKAMMMLICALHGSSYTVWSWASLIGNRDCNQNRDIASDDCSNLFNL